MDVTLKLAVDADIPMLIKLQQEAFEENYIKYQDDSSPHNEAPESMKAKMRLSHYYVILCDNVPVGGVFAYLLDDEHYKLNGLYVTPQYQRRGIADEALHQFMQKHPAKKWSVEIPLDSVKRQRFLLKQGFVPTNLIERINDRLTLQTYELTVGGDE